jgi:hypothetical protein
MVKIVFLLMVKAVRDAIREMTDPYRPELHYMRGPGPKWAERHGAAARVN